MALFLLIVLPLYLVFQPDIFTWKAYLLNLLNLQGFPFVLSSSGEGTLVGIRHLWFITAIMLGYFITPILQRYAKHSQFLLPVLLVLVSFSYFLLPGKWVFIASWFFLYAIAYMFVNIKKQRIYEIGILILEGIVLLFVGTHIKDVTSFYSPLYRILHDVTGLFIVIIGISVLTKVKISKLPSFVKILDEYSYHIFIVHYFLIIGPFSLAHITTSKIMNLVIMLFAIIVGSFLFKKLNDHIDHLLFTKEQK